MSQSTLCETVADRKLDSDQDLIQAALSGDQGGYAELARRYQDRLFASIRGDVGCPIMAEDIVQDAFIRAFVNLASFRGSSHFYTWLYRIALNSRRSYLRRNRATVALQPELEPAFQSRGDAPESPTRRVERHEEQNQVRDALDRLDEPHRRILILREFDGCDYQTIADILNVKMGTVRSRLARARTRLRRELREYFEAEPPECQPIVRSDFDSAGEGGAPCLRI